MIDSKQKTNWYLVTTVISVLVAITVSLTSLVHSNDIQEINECKSIAKKAQETTNKNCTEIAVIKAGLRDMDRRLVAIERKQDEQTDVAMEILRVVKNR